MGKTNSEAIAKAQILERMTAQVERIFDFQLALMDEDIARGWRCFYAKELWFRNNLSPPLINEIGKSTFLQAYARMLAGDLTDRFLRKVPPGYRNFINVGTLSIQKRGDAAVRAFDAVADEVTWRYMTEQNRHMWYEARANFNEWYREASFKCTHTPPLMYLESQQKPPVRDPDCELHANARYWCDVHRAPYQHVFDASNVFVHRTPDWTLKLMEELVPDFVFDEMLSSSKRLVFPQPGQAERKWAIVIEKLDGSPAFSFPPQLVLFAHKPGKRWSEAGIVFQHVDIFYRIMSAHEPCDIEMQLRWSVPRFRKLIGLYDDIIVARDNVA